MMTSLEKEPLSVNESAVANGRPLAEIGLDDEATAMLLSIARHHCKLALEHGKATTTAARRLEIIEEIQSLRSARQALIDQLRASQKIKLVS